MEDIVIIGGGVIGCLIARQLSKYKLKISLIEKHSEVSSGTSKANSSIVHAGFDAMLGSNKAKFNVRGNELMEQVCKELDVHFKRNGSLVLAFSEEEAEDLENLYKKGLANGVKSLSILEKEEILNLEPNISKDVIKALRAETAGIVCPYKLTHNAAENAAINGVNFIFNCELLTAEKTADYFILKTTKGDINGKIIINAAGIFADEVAKAFGDNSISIYPRKGEYLLMDKKQGKSVSHTIFQMPTKLGKGILVTPTVDGNLLIGPTAKNIEDKDDFETTTEGLKQVFEGAKKSVVNLSERNIITSFSGLRAISQTDDFIIEISKEVKNLINVAGIQSPGLSASPAIASFVENLVIELLGEIALKEIYSLTLKSKPQVVYMTEEELKKLIAEKPEYGKIVCRCEIVSEGEIKDAIHSECGAMSIDGIKRRTRAGMGRCQGGFCLPKVLEIISKEKNIKFTEVNKSDEGTYILVAETKGVLTND